MSVPALLPLALLGPALLAASGRDSVPAAFYNQPGANSAMRTAELERCRVIVTAPMSTADQKALTPPIEPAPLPRAALPSPSIETCMVTRGWRVYALSLRERKALARLSPKARARALDGLTAARHPSRGRLIRDGTGLRLRDPAVR
ncbi:hypothetical protein DAH55_16865 [Sphingomonas koreensis]|nr:hypothetical protein BDW16_1555 [Sphingomonas koreensis]RSU57665.1 hypothetical protein DAH56_17240 [Sphingomonas koreensis]RSU65779.1 hypothetical protein DAH55_16865 [Sphingomonas koreensis]